MLPQRILCALGRHAIPNPYFAICVENVWFAECPVCLTEIVKQGGKRWGRPPRGYRVVWRAFTNGESRIVRRAPALIRNDAKSQT